MNAPQNMPQIQAITLEEALMYYAQAHLMFLKITKAHEQLRQANAALVKELDEKKAEIEKLQKPRAAPALAVDDNAVPQPAHAQWGWKETPEKETP